jgi:DNA-binding LytR/AlgR family response regulator
VNSAPRLRALVVEDEWPARNYLVELLHGSGRAEVVGAVASANEARELLGRSDEVALDVAFVDVHLGADADAGLELVRAVGAQARAPAFVLATAYDRHAVEAYDLGVVDYLLKPFTQERVGQCLDRLTSRRAPVAHGPSRLAARSDKGLVFLDRAEVWAFEAAGRLTFVHTKAGRFDLDLSLAAIETSLDWDLSRVHRNWLVDLGHVKEMVKDGGETKLFVGRRGEGDVEGLWLPVARERAARVRDRLLADATGIRPVRR